jgi:hypothetical protein
MATGYSKHYNVKGRLYRYNYEACELEWISWFDSVFEGDELVEVKLDEPMVIDSIGLSPENWKDNPEYWIDCYAAEVEEELAALAEEFV